MRTRREKKQRGGRRKRERKITKAGTFRCGRHGDPIMRLQPKKKIAIRLRKKKTISTQKGPQQIRDLEKIKKRKKGEGKGWSGGTGTDLKY